MYSARKKHTNAKKIRTKFVIKKMCHRTCTYLTHKCINKSTKNNNTTLT